MLGWVTRRPWLAGVVTAGATLCAVCPGRSGAAPIEAYGRLPSVSNVIISPGGNRIAMLVGDATARQVQIRKADDLSVIGAFNVGDMKLTGLRWADEDNLLLVVAKAGQVGSIAGPSREWFLAYNLDVVAKQIHPLLQHEKGKQGDDTLLPSRMGATTTENMNGVVDWPQPRKIGSKTSLFLTGISFGNATSALTLYREDPKGSGAEQVFQSPPRTSDLLIDRVGKPVARVDYAQDGGEWSLIGRAGAGDWHTLHRETAPIDTPVLEGFGRTEDTLIVGQDGDGGTQYREVPLAGGNWSEPIAALDGASLITDPVTRTVIGGVVTDDTAVHHVFLDPQDQALWNKVSRAFPGETVRLASWSDDRSRIVLRVEGPKTGAAYFSLDVKTHHAQWIANEYADIHAEDLGEVRVIRYKTADGREIPAYLTLPHGAEAKGLPLVLVVHGGPTARDVPGFDWWAQAIASMGYAVLQPQFRGSAGFGRDLLSAGYGEWGRKMQTDLSDGVRYLAGQGMVDAKRVCITGASYGGYAAMAGVTLQSGIYKCAVAVAGVSDLRQMLAADSYRMGGARNATLRYWQRFIGAKGMGDPVLDTLSPARHAADLSAQLLLIHGTIDTVVPFDQSKTMLDAAKRAGKPVQLVTLTGEDHNLARSATRLQMLQAMGGFLRTNLPVSPPGPGSAALATAAPPR